MQIPFQAVWIHTHAHTHSHVHTSTFVRSFQQMWHISQPVALATNTKLKTKSWSSRPVKTPSLTKYVLTMEVKCIFYYFLLMPLNNMCMCKLNNAIKECFVFFFKAGYTHLLTWSNYFFLCVLTKQTFVLSNKASNRWKVGVIWNQ